MSTYVFEPVGHLYTVDGVVTPSVTQALELAGISDVSGIPPHILEKAAAIGKAVHEATQFLDEGDLDIDSLDPKIVGYVTAYQKFKEDTGFKPDLIEYRMVGEVNGLKYGMCADRTGELAGKHIVGDLKTGSRVQPHWAIQTAAYGHALGITERAAFHLKKDGQYEVILYQNEHDFEVWDSALCVAHWRLKHGAKLK